MCSPGVSNNLVVIVLVLAAQATRLASQKAAKAGRSSKKQYLLPLAPKMSQKIGDVAAEETFMKETYKKILEGKYFTLTLDLMEVGKNSTGRKSS